MKVGDTIYLEPQGNAARYNKSIREAVVTKVGKKYFETERYGRFCLDTMRHHAGQLMSQYNAYTSLQEAEDKLLRDQLSKSLPFKVERATLDQLKQIKNILEL